MTAIPLPGAVIFLAPKIVPKGSQYIQQKQKMASDPPAIATLPHWTTLALESEQGHKEPAEQGTGNRVSIKQKVTVLASWIDHLLFGSAACQANQPCSYLGVCMHAWAWNDKTAFHSQ